MPDSFSQFFLSNPFWAIVIVVLMALPIIGAVAWIILRALRKQDDFNKDTDKN